MAMALGIVSFPMNPISWADTEHVQGEAEGTQNSSLTEGKVEEFLATFSLSPSTFQSLEKAGWVQAFNWLCGSFKESKDPVM